MPQYELNLRDYVRIFRRRRTAIIIIFILVMIGSSFYSRGAAPVYEAVTTVKIEERKTVAGLLTEWIMLNPGDMMESETKLIKGSLVLKKSALRLGLTGESSSEEDINKVVAELEEKISAERIGSTNIIKITAKSSIAPEAIEIANMVASVYIEENLLGKTLQARSTRQFIEEQLSSLEIRLKEKEDKLRDLSTRNANVTLAEPIQKKLAELQFELTGLLQKYTERHPNVIQARDQISELEKYVKGISNEDLAYGRLTREVDADKKLYSLLKEKLEEARITEAQKVGDISVVNPAVTALAAAGPNRAIGFIVGGILGIVLGFSSALILESLDTSIGTIEAVEEIMKVPVLGVIPSVRLKEDSKIKNKLFLFLKRKIMQKQYNSEEEERYTRLIVQYNSTSPIAEAYRNIHTNLKLDNSKRTLLIASSGPKEGKSTVLSNLGLAIAQTGIKTLLISSDIRRPILAKTFGVQKEPGLTEVLLGMVPFEEAVKNVTDFMLGDIGFEDIKKTPGVDNLWLLTSGQLPFNPAKILESKELASLIEDLKQRFDLLIFDSPPILPVTDAIIMASKIDTVIMVYEVGRTSRDALLRAKNQLDSAGAKIAGIVLNQTQSESTLDMVYPYYYKYKYQREGAEKPYKKGEKAFV